MENWQRNMCFIPKSKKDISYGNIFTVGLLSALDSIVLAVSVAHGLFSLLDHY